jgi:hypothetical protein
VGRHEARHGRTAVRVAVAVAVAAVAAAAVASGLGSTGPRVDHPRGPPPTPGSVLIAAPGFGVGVEGWRALPGTFVIKGRLGAPTASYARVQRDPTVPPRRDPATRSTVTGMATRVRVAATVGMPLRATVRVRAARPGTTVVVRLSERVGGKDVGGSERRAMLPGTGWRRVVAAHRVRRAGAAVYLEISALALPVKASFDVDQAKVTSP